MNGAVPNAVTRARKGRAVRGFTLLEVLVALALVGGSFAVLFQVFATNAVLTRRYAEGIASWQLLHAEAERVRSNWLLPEQREWETEWSGRRWKFQLQWRDSTELESLAKQENWSANELKRQLLRPAPMQLQIAVADERTGLFRTPAGPEHTLWFHHRRSAR
jgi:prepilin-type N-terminal cleavage/methylation domain-containing protein